MPCGHHIAHCLHCGREWIVGDCIPSMCEECREQGHRDGPFFDCSKCQEPMIRIQATKLLADEKAKAEAAKQEAAARAKVAEEAEFSAGIL